MKTIIAISLVSLALLGCTNVKIKNIDPSLKLSHVCIEDNPKVIVGQFIPVVQNGFTRHGLTTEVYEGRPPVHCQHRLTYTALKKWDIGMYMHHAELHLYEGRNPIGSAIYHLNGGGGLALNKWASVKSKMDPVIDELLSGYTPEVVDSYRSEYIEAGADEVVNDRKETLEILKEWHEDGLIDGDEYEREKQRILSEL